MIYQVNSAVLNAKLELQKHFTSADISFTETHQQLKKMVNAPDLVAVKVKRI